MNNIINLSQLITRLAKVTDTDPNTARRFLRTFFATIEDALAEGETVEIKGIGTFRRCDDPAVGTPGTVGFAPDSDFAEEINRPFAVFEAVELADGLTAEDLEPEIQTEGHIQPEEEYQVQETQAELEETTSSTAFQTQSQEESLYETTEEFTAKTHEVPTTEIADNPSIQEPQAEHKAPWEIYGKGSFIEEAKAPETEEETITITENISGPENESTDETAIYDTEEEIDDDEERRHKRIWIWIAAAVLALAGIGGYLAAVVTVPIPSYDDIIEEETEPIESITETEPTAELTAEEAIATDLAKNSAIQQPETTATEPQDAVQTSAPVSTPSKEPKYDTVTSKRYLAIMAREYYGRSIYWVFIYEANADKLTDPNKVAPGTRVLIPDKESLPGSSEAERTSIAEKKAAAIQAKYK